MNLLSFAFASCFILSSCATTISGRIVSVNAATPVTAGKVNVQRLDSATTRTVADVTADGTFETKDDLPDGTYLVEPLIPGFKSEAQTIKSENGNGLLFKVSPLPTSKRAAIGAGSDSTIGRGEGGAVLTPPEM